MRVEDLCHVLMRPKMYVGDGPDASNSLAWFINGYMAARQGFTHGSLFVRCPCEADPDKTLEQNASAFLEVLRDDGITCK